MTLLSSMSILACIISPSSWIRIQTSNACDSGHIHLYVDIDTRFDYSSHAKSARLCMQSTNRKKKAAAWAVRILHEDETFVEGSLLLQSYYQTSLHAGGLAFSPQSGTSYSLLFSFLWNSWLINLAFSMISVQVRWAQWDVGSGPGESGSGLNNNTIYFLLIIIS